MAFNILPQVINVAKKVVNPIKSKPTTEAPPESTTNKPTSSTVSSGSANTTTSKADFSTDSVAQSDFRIKISMPPAAPNIFYLDENNLLMLPLQETNGFIFPIQPDISLSHSAEYQTTKPTHSNFPYYHYTNSEIQQISITGDFPIRSVFDARYVNAGIHFLRCCTKMFNSADSDIKGAPSLAGAPPMVLRLSGLGFTIYDNIPVVLSSVNVTYPSSVDFITFKPFPLLTETAKLPTNLTIQLTLNPIFSRSYISNTYSTLNYSKGVGLLGVTRPLDKLVKYVPPVLETPPDIPAPPPTSIKDLPVAIGLGTLPQTLSGKDLTMAEVNDYYSQIEAQGATVSNAPPPPPQEPGVTTSGPKIPGSPAGFGGSVTPTL